MAFERENKKVNDDFGFSDNNNINIALEQSKKLDEEDSQKNSLSKLSNLNKVKDKTGSSNRKMATFYIDEERRIKFQKIADRRGYRSASEFLRDIIDNLN